MATLSSRITDLTAAVRDKINLMVPRLLPSGGTGGQVLAKNSATNYDTAWTTLSGSGTPVSSLSAISYLDGSELVQVRSGSTDYKATYSQLNAGAFVKLQSDYTLTSTTAGQKLFNHTTNGALILPTGSYTFDCFLYLQSMSGTSGNGAFWLLGAGTAVLDRVVYLALGNDAATLSTPASQTGTWTYNSTLSNTNILSTTTGTMMAARISGIFDVSTAGTIIPSFALQTAASAVVKANSFFQVQRISAAASSSQGNWS